MNMEATKLLKRFFIPIVIFSIFYCVDIYLFKQNTSPFLWGVVVKLMLDSWDIESDLKNMGKN